MSSDARKKFFTMLVRFVDDLKAIKPDDKDLALFKDAVKMFERTNPANFLAMTREKVLNKYRESIVRRDASFILEQARVQVEEEDNSFTYVVEKLGQWWEEMREDQRETIWKWLGVLVVLADRATA